MLEEYPSFASDSIKNCVVACVYTFKCKLEIHFNYNLISDNLSALGYKTFLVFFWGESEGKVLSFADS